MVKPIIYLLFVKITCINIVITLGNIINGNLIVLNNVKLTNAVEAFKLFPIAI